MYLIEIDKIFVNSIRPDSVEYSNYFYLLQDFEIDTLLVYSLKFYDGQYLYDFNKFKQWFLFKFEILK